MTKFDLISANHITKEKYIKSIYDCNTVFKLMGKEREFVNN